MSLASEPGGFSALVGPRADLDLVLDLLGYADEARTLGEVLARTTERLASAAGAWAALGLALSPADSVDAAPSGWLPPGAVVDLVRRVRPSIAEAAWIGPSGAPCLRAQAALVAAESAASGDRCLWLLHRAVDFAVALILFQPATARGRATDEALRDLLAAVVDRHLKAVRQRRRLERAAALSHVLEELASHLDVDRTFATIAERARDLLGADSAFLAEFDEARRTMRVRVSLGLHDEVLRHGVVEIGQGLAGAAALSRRVMWTHDYMSDTGFAHTSEADASVRREGLRSMLVAPLQAGDRLLGILGVTNHRAIDFGDDDRELIKHLADGAAVALENARLYVEQAALVSRLRSLNEQARQQNDAARRSQLIHDQLSELVLQGRSVDEIAGRLSSLIGNPVVVLGPYLNRIAGSDPEDAREAPDRFAVLRSSPAIRAEVERLATERRPVHLAPDARLGLSHSLLIAPILSGPDLLGYGVVIEAERTFSPLDFQALEQAAMVFALELTRERFVEEAEHRLRGDFLHDLIASNVDDGTIVQRARRLGHDLALPQLLLATALDESNDLADDPSRPDRADRVGRLERALRTSLRQRGLMAQTSVVAGRVISLVALPSHAAHADAIRPLLETIVTDLAAYLAPRTASIGVGRVRRGPAELRQTYHEALQALTGSQRLGGSGKVAEYDRLGVERLLTQLMEDRALDGFVDDVLGPLMAYDGAHGSDLVVTLDTFLRSACRQRATADALGIHVNSLHYRLQRIQEVGGVDLEDAEVRLNLQLALRARLVLRTTREEP